uniref:hypothetical protein n=1 Tax=Azospirillum argentinense TaxID=2970906 RepID=UPI001585D6C1|nr:hypothetical protein [Azospirillum argentinense]
MPPAIAAAIGRDILNMVCPSFLYGLGDIEGFFKVIGVVFIVEPMSHMRLMRDEYYFLLNFFTD